MGIFWFALKSLLLGLKMLLIVVLTYFFFHPVKEIFFIISIWKFSRFFIITAYAMLIFWMQFHRWLFFFRIYIGIGILSWLLAGLLIWLNLLILRRFILNCIYKWIFDFLVNRLILFLIISITLIINLFLISYYLRWIFIFLFD